MKTTELMIGDKVMVKVLSQIPNTYVLHTWTANDYSRDIQVKPIPLTPEILEKNGWNLDPVLQCYTSTPLWLYGEGSINLLLQFPTKQSAGSLKIIDNQKIRNLSDFTWKDRLYIHELQHALRLCGFNKLADNFKV